jgi:hypothetical protein
MAALGAWAVAAASLALTLVPLDAAAELFRCTGPDGKTVYTDKKSVCPQAETYTPKAELQGTDPQPASAGEEGEESASDARLRTLRRMKVDDARAGEAARWQQLKKQKEDELEDVKRERDHLVDYVAHCNRGGSVITRDDAGMAKDVKCNELNDKLAALDERALAIRNYLDNDLPEECRKAGCLPGWLR